MLSSPIPDSFEIDAKFRLASPNPNTDYGRSSPMIVGTQPPGVSSSLLLPPPPGEEGGMRFELS